MVSRFLASTPALRSLLLVVPLTVLAADRTVDLRFGIPTWHQPLGVPDDWHKPMADERGALLYDFGPGPYVQPATTVAAAAAGKPFALERQDWVDSPRLPALRTVLRRGPDTIEITTLALPPAAPAPSEGRTATYERLDGITGALGWAKPPGEASPEFRNVAWGITRPLRYRFRVAPGAAKRVMLGFCESYKLRLGDRLAEMHVEGAPALTLDLALNAPLNQPQVFLFDAIDTDRNGWIDVTVLAPQGHDPNTTLATIAVYPADLRLTRAELVAGSRGPADRAELRIACGTEARRAPPRTDLIHARYSNRAQPTLTLATGRALELRADGVVTDDGVPFVLTAPRATGLAKTATGWQLDFAPGTPEISAWVFSGQADAATVAAARALTPAAALGLSRERWARIAIPYGRITVADPRIQAFVDGSIRTLYQARENINGQSQFDSSFSLYRGLWAGDAVYLTSLAAMLGDSATGRQTLDALFAQQNTDGIIDELHPQQIYRTTAEVLWAVTRDAEISGDWSYARARWPQIMRGVAGIRALRDKTLAQPDAPYGGMFPPGFSDGGILDIGAEYSSVYCTITGLRATVRAAEALGLHQDAGEIARLAAEFRAAYDRHRLRDQRRDRQGNLYLPVRVGLKGDDPIPQLTQWAVFDAHLNGEGWIPSDHELVTGTLAVLDSVERQGLPVSMGWMPGGNWAGMGLFIAFQHLVLGHDAKTADMLYAAANHASPRGTWVEEQSLIGDPLKLAGDQPHCFAAAMFVQLAGSMLAYDRENTVHLLGSVPVEWLHPGAVNRLDAWQTGAGTVTLALTVSLDGRTATLKVEPINRADKKIRIVLHTASLEHAGFAPPASAQDGLIEIQPGQPVSLVFPEPTDRIICNVMRYKLSLGVTSFRIAATIAAGAVATRLWPAPGTIRNSPRGDSAACRRCRACQPWVNALRVASLNSAGMSGRPAASTIRGRSPRSRIPATTARPSIQIGPKPCRCCWKAATAGMPSSPGRIAAAAAAPCSGCDESTSTRPASVAGYRAA
ncbi:hypothetical protein [Opitutus sp. GAS368]|uniref:hypothetical protein n=1 Tax=Opitutus sp. GAS368 TaxID=1882749 RepID=UPI00087B675A|nr:hypothetical protein [Opitutus sp. GAS368]SDR84808.1 Glucoamylase (glucan-1,4-alpha-glucosidase), GH15 family [Opitutus sp. GAS368]